MAGRQRHDLLALDSEIGITADVERSGRLLDQACEGSVDLAFGAGSEQDDLQAKRSRGDLNFIQLQIDIRIVRVQQHGNDGGVGRELVQQFQSLRREQIGEKSYTRDIAA